MFPRIFKTSQVRRYGQGEISRIRPRGERICGKRVTNNSSMSLFHTSRYRSSTHTGNTIKRVEQAESKSNLKRKILGDEAIIPCRSILPLSLVNHPRVQALLPFIGNAAYIGIASGFLMTDMLQLRVILAGGYTGLVVYHILRPKPLRIPLRWSAVFILVNAGAAGVLLADRYLAPLSDEEEILYEKHFSNLTRGQFYQLLSLSTREYVNDKTVLTREGVPCTKLFFFEQGRAQVYHHKAHASNIETGGFVNDVAFQRGEKVGAYGTVILSEKSTLLVWDQAELRKHLKERPAMERNLKYMLSDHLVKSLLRQREAAHRRQQALKDEGVDVLDIFSYRTKDDDA